MRIAIVNDMPLAVEALRRALASSAVHQVIWTARDGAEAVAQCARQMPDLILMDMLMPRMDGVEATKRIMAATPCPILVVTSSIGANSSRVFEAMGHGALDAVDTPVFKGGDIPKEAAPLLAKIDTIGRVVRDKDSGRSASAHPFPLGIGSQNRLVAIGASAGGPAALAAVLGGLPANFPAAIVVVQHVDVQFAPGMADWLGRLSKLPVRLAREGDQPTAGTVLLAATNDHLVLNAGSRLGYAAEPRSYVYRPSVDVFFQGVARYWTGPAAAVLLTGMGRDGAVGLKALRNQGRHTIAQDRATSAVYGMPKAAVTLNAAVEVLPLGQIASRLTTLFPPQPGATAFSSPHV